MLYILHKEEQKPFTLWLRSKERRKNSRPHCLLQDLSQLECELAPTHRCLCLNTCFPAGDAMLEGYKTIRSKLSVVAFNPSVLGPEAD